MMPASEAAIQPDDDEDDDDVDDDNDGDEVRTVAEAECSPRDAH